MSSQLERQRQAFHKGMQHTTIPMLKPGYDLQGIKDNFATNAVTTALVYLGLSHRKASRCANGTENGTPRKRFDAAIDRLGLKTT